MAIFCVLALSGLWGLYRYGRLAAAVSQRAAEIPFAHELNNFADAIRDNYSPSDDLRAQSGMIETSLTRRHDFVNAFVDFQMTLSDYATKIDERSELATTQLSDDASQRQSIAEIKAAFHQLDRTRTKPDLTFEAKHHELSNQMDHLSSLTEVHLESMHAGIKSFSEDVREQYRRSIQLAAACGIFAIVMLSVLWWVFRSQVAKPFETLLDGSRLVAAGQFGHRIDLGTQDELSELAEAMNGMSKQFLDVVERQKAMNAALDQQVKQRTREVIQNEQLASVGFLAAGVAHEINNPLASIAWSAESLERQVDELTLMYAECGDTESTEMMKTNLRRIQEEAFRCSGITERLLDFSRLGDVRRTSTNLGELVEDVVSMVRRVGKYRCKTVRTHCQQDVHAHVNAQEIRQVVLNLVTNAMESVDTDGTVDVDVQTRGQAALVRVADNGCGMSQEVMEHLFEPFFTRRRDGTGTGLGLSITYRIVSQHHGSLTAHSDGEGCGSRLEMLLPTQPCCDDGLEHNHDNNHGWNDVAQKVT
jgi:signal transduction histidine kinase